MCSLVVQVDGEDDINTSVDLEVSDLLDNGGGAPHIDDSLVDSHLVVIVGVGTVTARGATGGHGEDLGGDTFGAGNFVVVLFGTGNDLGASVLEGLDFTTTESHSNLVDVLVDFLLLLHVFLSHLVYKSSQINNNTPLIKYS